MVDPAGNAIDPTWSEPGRRYLGITFPDVGALDLGGPTLSSHLVTAVLVQLADNPLTPAAELPAPNLHEFSHC